MPLLTPEYPIVRFPRKVELEYIVALETVLKVVGIVVNVRGVAAKLKLYDILSFDPGEATLVLTKLPELLLLAISKYPFWQLAVILIEPTLRADWVDVNGKLEAEAVGVMVKVIVSLITAALIVRVFVTKGFIVVVKFFASKVKTSVYVPL